MLPLPSDESLPPALAAACHDLEHKFWAAQRARPPPPPPASAVLPALAAARPKVGPRLVAAQAGFAGGAEVGGAAATPQVVVVRPGVSISAHWAGGEVHARVAARVLALGARKAGLL